MTAYSVHFNTGASSWVTVEADSVDEAIDKAYGEVHVALCHQCARDLDVGDEFVASAVYDEDTGEQVWEADDTVWIVHTYRKSDDEELGIADIYDNEDAAKECASATVDVPVFEYREANRWAVQSAYDGERRMC